jgi:hypothetical protein
MRARGEEEAGYEGGEEDEGNEEEEEEDAEDAVEAEGGVYTGRQLQKQ